MSESTSWTEQELIDLLDHDLITERYFFPQREGLPDAFGVETGGGRLACWRSAPPSNRPVLLHFHGNGELVHHWNTEFANWAVSLGFDVFLAEYRGYGDSEGIPRLASMLDDVSAIVEATGVSPGRIMAFGRSIGSLYAVEMVHRYPGTMGLVLESGIANLMERILVRVTPEELNSSQAMLEAALDSKFNQERKLRRYTNPCLFLHAEQDNLVVIGHAESNLKAAATEDKELVRFSRGDHNSIFAMNQQVYLSKLAGFMQRLGS